MTFIHSILWIILISPVAALLTMACLPRVWEKAISRVMLAGVLPGIIGGTALAAAMIHRGFHSTTAKGIVLWKERDHAFAIDLFVDPSGLTYLILASFLTTIVITFSKSYLHRESGYKRFFWILGCFYLGISTVVLAGNLELLFVGWEIVGATSFFLISFYHERYLAVKNAFKVVSLYRVADIAMLSGIWVIHHHFPHFHFEANHQMLSSMPSIMAATAFLIAAMVKSGQFPFSFWVPRAMEGPSTSSAIFYGALSTHLGVFLLLRTIAFWHDSLTFRIIIAVVGLITFSTAKWMSWVQPTVKAKIGYASVAQVGLIFVELACGWVLLAHIHLVLNSLFRCYQILVSPSALNYKIQNQIFLQSPASTKSKAPGRWTTTLYVLAVHEFFLNRFFSEVCWNNLKLIGRMLLRLRVGNAAAYLIAGLVVVSISALWPMNPFTQWKRLPEAMVLIGWIFLFRALSTRGSARSAWGMMLLNQLFLFTALWLEASFDLSEAMLYLSGVVLAGATGTIILSQLSRIGADLSLGRFHGHGMRHEIMARIFAFAVLAIAGFPITPTFLGEELMLSHIGDEQWILMLMVIINLVLDGFVGMRLYCRIFLGGGRGSAPPLNYRSA